MESTSQCDSQGLGPFELEAGEYLLTGVIFANSEQHEYQLEIWREGERVDGWDSLGIDVLYKSPGEALSAVLGIQETIATGYGFVYSNEIPPPASFSVPALPSLREPLFQEYLWYDGSKGPMGGYRSASLPFPMSRRRAEAHCRSIGRVCHGLRSPLRAQPLEEAGVISQTHETK